jgi:hypothetical protein
MKDDTGATVPLAFKDPGFVKDPTNLKTLFDGEMNKPRTDPVTAKLGVHTFAELGHAPHALSVALADLTTDPQHPQYVGFHDTDRMGAASLGKIAGIYAAHQIKFDAQTKAENAPAEVTGDPDKKRKWVFEQLRNDWTAKKLPAGDQAELEKILVTSPAGDLVFEPQFKQRMMDITHPHPPSADETSVDIMNNGVGYIIMRMGYPYLASTLVQSGLFNETKGGLWISWGYGAPKWFCKKKLVKAPGGFATQEITAIAAATYLTLVEQERFISQKSSQEIKAVLEDGDTGWLMGEFPSALGVDAGTISIFGKHGDLLDFPTLFTHQGMLIERKITATKTLKYVVVCLIFANKKLRTETGDDLLKFIDAVMIPAFDSVIASNNP